MSLKELLQLKEVQDHFGIVVREEYPFRATLKFAEDMAIVGVDVNNNRIAVIPYYNGNLCNIEVRDILVDYNIVDFITKYGVERKDWDLECTWLENWSNYEEESYCELLHYAETSSIFILEKKYDYPKLTLKECVDNGEVSEMQ